MIVENSFGRRGHSASCIEPASSGAATTAMASSFEVRVSRVWGRAENNRGRLAADRMWKVRGGR